jgi:PRC-barrel domain
MPQVLTHDVWMYRDPTLATSLNKQQIVGYEVESIDGSIGKIDDASFETDTGHIVVDTGPWIFGRKVMLPVGVLRNVDHENEKVFVNRTKDEIKNSPEFEDTLMHDEGYRTKVGSYYGQGGRGYRDW